MNRILSSLLLVSALIPCATSNAQNKGFTFNETGTVKVQNFATPTGDFSIESWAKINSVGSNTDDIISTHENSSQRKGYFLEYAFGSNSVLKAGIANSSNAWTTAEFSANWVVGQWHHVVMTYNAASKTMKIYQDGALMATNTLGAYTAVFSTRPLGIGCSDNYTGNGFAGSVDEVYFWDKELTASAIDSSAHLFRPENAMGLRAYYKLDTLAGTTVYDATANGLNGVAGNMTQSSVVLSKAPIALNPTATFTGYKGNWWAKNTNTSAGLTVVSNYTTDQNYTILSHTADSGIAVSGLPASLQSRLKRNWKFEKAGTAVGVDTLKFSLSANNMVSNIGNLFLVTTNDGTNYNYYDSIPGVVNGDVVSFVVADTISNNFGLASTSIINLSTLTRGVATGTDDAEEYVVGGTGTVGQMDLTSSDLEIMYDGTKKQMIGVRFANMTIPAGSQIVSANIQFATKGDKNPVLGDAHIFVEDADNPVTFATTASNLTSRAKLADSVLWLGSTSTTWGTTAAAVAGPDQKTPDITSLIQATINRSGWASGNAIALYLTGDGVRNAYSYDGSSASAAKLIIQYIAPYTQTLATTSFPIAKNSSWKYLDDGTNQGTAWTAASFNDATWAYGPGKLGYSDNPATTLSYGPNASNKYITYYFRKPFTVSNLSTLTDSLELNILRDDGAVVFINGVEVLRSNMPAGTYDYSTFSSTTVDGTDESTYYPYVISKNVLVNGVNTIAVEIHQRDGTSSDLGFDMELIEHVVPSAPSLLRGPYLNSGTPTSMVVRWRTDIASKSKVMIGTAAGALTQTFLDTASVTEHIVKVTGLTPYSKYYYSIGSDTVLLEGTAQDFFYTLPVSGTSDSLIRIGVIGDCGNNSTNQRDVRDKLSTYLGSNYMNSWILLGDNAYSYGYDAEYQAEFFNIYKDQFLKQNPLYPSPGNHDYGNSTSSASVTNHALAAYYQNFSMPDSGEAGGLASNNPAFYSYNVGNIHFLSLDSYGKESDATHLYDTTGVQVQWIKQDLAANTNKGWVVAYWHHPPYTMGSHNSDSESDLVAIRQNFIKILERYGVDLILCGHSHDYERSKLMQGHYGNENTFNAAVNNLSTSSGMYDGSANSCPYVKDSVTNYQGTVYVVSGSAGQLGGSQAGYPHDAMPYSDATHGGSMILEVKGNRLDAKWICADGIIRDQFTMMKDVNRKRVLQINAGDNVTLAANFNGTYNWQGVSSTAKEVNVTPADTTTYIVTDGNSCVADTFVVNVLATPLSLTWGNVTASTNGSSSNIINWETLNEKNVAMFEVERASGTGLFETVGAIRANGNTVETSKYSFVDNQIDPSVPLYLYRIRQIGTDAKESYSKVVTVSRKSTANAALIIAPNPAKDKEMVIALDRNEQSAASITVTDITGSKVFSAEMVLGQTPQTFLPVLQDGIYILNVKCAGQTFTKKIVIKN